MLSRGALVQVPTGDAVRIECVASGAGTAVRSLCVLACELAGRWCALTLIDINAARSRVVWLVALVTDASIRPHGVDALAVATKIRHLALINV